MEQNPTGSTIVVSAWSGVGECLLNLFAKLLFWVVKPTNVIKCQLRDIDIGENVLISRLLKCLVGYLRDKRGEVLSRERWCGTAVGLSSRDGSPSKIVQIVDTEAVRFTGDAVKIIILGGDCIRSISGGGESLLKNQSSALEIRTIQLDSDTSILDESFDCPAEQKMSVDNSNETDIVAVTAETIDVTDERAYDRFTEVCLVEAVKNHDMRLCLSTLLKDLFKCLSWVMPTLLE
jgi:hypothetical protein